MGEADYLKLGDHNAQCFECGRKFKAGTLKRHWKGYWVCPEHWEMRQPQDFVRGTTDKQTPSWVQPQPAPVFVPDAPDIPIAQPSDYPIIGEN